MPDHPGKNGMRIVKFVIGGALLVWGVTLVLVWWNDVVILFKGVGGMAVALCGMIILYLAKE